ncbi:DNA mismatch repair protein MutL [Halobacteriales archaeon QS_1_68_20]|nr:MAG: DNA mismatch repair protein MutL [Halobacteriales archaeon QS_1_68_20]
MPDAEEITELDDATVDKIAAGEVVERPASVVKELVENSLDAAADRVEVAVERGGKDLVRVRDDGVGMTEAAVRKAVRQHTTSKIRDADDLDGVGTLGFRGEALHTIGAVSRLTIRTKPRGGDRGTELRMEGGEVAAVEPTGCPEGTTVEVTDLFYNTPAREKYLKQDRTEFARVNDVVTRYALANPDVAVSLEHDGREVFSTTGQRDLRATVLAVYGRQVAQSMVPVEAEAPEDGPLEGISGYVSHPETTRSSRDYVSTFVNGRWVRSGAAREAVVEAYGNQLAADRYPFAVLFLDVPADSVDVNVHPRKMEVRFADEAGLREQVETAVREALLDHGLLRSSAPRGRSAPDQATIEPSSPSTDTDDATTDSTTDTAKTSEATDDGSRSRPSPDTGPARSSASPSSPQESSEDTKPWSRTSRSTARSSSTSGSASSSSPRPSRSPVTNDPDTQTTLSGDDAHPTTEYDNFPSLRVLGQLHDTYIVAEADDGLLLIDQHAADERVNYERLSERFEGDTTTQALADPVELELTAREAAHFDDYQDALARLGFHANRIGDRTVEVTTVPGFVAESVGPSVIRDVLADLIEGEGVAEKTVEAIADDLLSDMACYPSITGNTSLTDGSVVDLLSALDDCENPWACPHGRPVLIHIDSAEIDDRFERDYPGH